MPLILLNFPSVPNPVGTIKSIVNVQEQGSQEMDWSYALQAGVMQSTRAYKNTLRVITSSGYVGPIQIQQALIGIGAVQGAYYVFPLPELNGNPDLPGSHTEQDTGSFLHSINIKQETEDARQWLCTFSYGPNDIAHEIGTSNANIGSSNPLETAPEVEWTPAIYEEFYPQDINGIPFLNSVGDPLEDPPKREVSRQTLSFTRNESDYNDSYAQQFRETINQLPFLGFGPHQAKCKTISGRRIHTADYGYYWQVKYDFEFRVVTFVVPETFDPISGLPNDDGVNITYGWEDLVLNAGFRQLDGSGNLAQILVNGMAITAPVALNENGKPYNTTTTPNAPLPLPFYLVFQQYPEQDFSQLNIPDTVLTENQ